MGKQLFINASKMHPIWDERKSIFTKRGQEILSHCIGKWVDMNTLSQLTGIRTNHLLRYTKSLLICGAISKKRLVKSRKFDLVHYTFEFRTNFYPVENVIYTEKQFDKKIDRMWDYDEDGIILCYPEGWAEDFIRWDVEPVIVGKKGDNTDIIAGIRGSIKICTQSAWDKAKIQYNILTLGDRLFDEEFVFDNCYIFNEQDTTDRIE